MLVDNEVIPLRENSNISQTRELPSKQMTATIVLVASDIVDFTFDHIVIIEYIAFGSSVRVDGRLYSWIEQGCNQYPKG